MKGIVRTRIAPSPTGEDLHIGSLYMALFNYAFAQKHNGKFIIRVEDTDRLRFVSAGEERMLKSLKWAGITYDEGPDIGGPYAPYKQSQRLGIYQKHAQDLVEQGKAYCCFCTSERLDKLRKEQQKKGQPSMYDGLCKSLNKLEAKKRTAQESHVIRFNVPDAGQTVFTDILRGKISFENVLLDDQVILKSDGYPTYHLAVVVDDHLMEITHVIRGEEWISSTPKHVMLYWAFGWTLPYFAHLPLLRNPDKSKMSKRKNPVWTSWYREQGYLPQALLNYISTLTWSMPDGKEKFTLAQMIAEFDLKKIKTTAPIFDLEKLNWLNGEYIRALSDEKLESILQPYLPEKVTPKLLKSIVPLARERMKKLTDISLYLKPFLAYTPATLNPKQKKIISLAHDRLLSVSAWKKSDIEEELKEMVNREGYTASEAFMAVRLGVTGEKIGLPLFETLEILGRVEVMRRLKTST